MKHRPALKTLLLAAGFLGVLSYGTDASAVPADPMYTFSFSIGGDAGSGILDLVGTNAIDGTLHVSSGPDVGDYTLYTGPAQPYFGATWDTFVDPGANPPIDNTGLLFLAGDFFINLWSDTPDLLYGMQACTTPQGGDPTVDSATCRPFSDGQEGSFSLTAVPEPATLSLLGASLLGFGLFRRRRNG
jgi:hypothetical protein